MGQLLKEEKHRKYRECIGHDEVLKAKAEEIRKAEKAAAELKSLAKSFRIGLGLGDDNELVKEIFKKKEKLVLDVHTHAITHMVLGSGRECWQTRLGDKKPRYSSYEGIIGMLYEHYFGEKEEKRVPTFSEVMKMAIEDRMLDGIKDKTVSDYDTSCRTLIPREMMEKPITEFSTDVLRKILLDYTLSKKPKKKQFVRMKTFLNLVFGYASDPEVALIERNPVPNNNRRYATNFTPTKKDPEDKAFQPEEITVLREHVKERIKKNHYDVNAMAILFASYTGVRVAEIPSLKWSDVGTNELHIHSQLNDHKVNGQTTYYYNPLTKDEARGRCTDGRYFPMTDELANLFSVLREKQKQLGIYSDDGWVFCKKDGTFMTTKGYSEALYKICKKLNLSRSNNHAFRMSLNSYVFIPLDIPVTERARILGHSVRTNEMSYAHSRIGANLELSRRLNENDAEQNSKSN